MIADAGKRKEQIKEHIAKLARKLGYDSMEPVFTLTLGEVLVDGLIEVYGEDCLRMAEKEFEEAMHVGVKATEYIDWYEPVQSEIEEYRNSRKTGGYRRDERSAA